MASFILCIAAGFWNFYNFFSYIAPDLGLPYVQLFDTEAHIFRVLNMLFLNWSPILGFLLIVFGVVGLIVRKMDTNNFSQFRFFMVVFAFITTVGLML